MKRLVLLLALFIFSFTNAQKMDKDFLEGTWETEFHIVEFKKINKKELRITILLKDSKKKSMLLNTGYMAMLFIWKLITLKTTGNL